MKISKFVMSVSEIIYHMKIIEYSKNFEGGVFKRKRPIKSFHLFVCTENSGKLIKC